MISRQRQLAAMRRQDVDYVPLHLTFWSAPQPEQQRWQREREQLARCDQLGIDKVICVGVRPSRSPAVTARVWQTEDDGLRCTLLHKEFQTPAGPLSATVRRTEDWPWGDDIPLLDDFSPPRFVKPWVESLEDIERLRYVLQPASGNDRERTIRDVREASALARECDAVLRGSGGNGLDIACWLCGFEQAIVLAVEQPEVISGLVDLESRLTHDRVTLLCELGVDYIDRRGCYESADFWSPALFERFARPALEAELSLVHACGRPIVYWMLTGIEPLLPQLRAIPFDMLRGAEPGTDAQAHRTLARMLGESKGFLGGISALDHLTQTPELVRRAVRQAFDTFGHRGFILGATGSIRPYYPKENIQAMVEEWKRCRSSGRST